MPQEADASRTRQDGSRSRPSFGEYASEYVDHFGMSRDEGIIELRMHTACRLSTATPIGAVRAPKRGLANEVLGGSADGLGG